MFDSIIRASLKNVWLVIAGTMALVGVGVYAQQTLPLDVLPELAAPSTCRLRGMCGIVPQLRGSRSTAAATVLADAEAPRP